MVQSLGRITLRLTTRFFLPLLWGFLVDLFKLVVLAQVNYFRNIPETTRNMANEWRIKAAAYGWPSQLDKALYYGGRVAAFLMLLVGWIINAYLTVWLLNLIF